MLRVPILLVGSTRRNGLRHLRLVKIFRSVHRERTDRTQVPCHDTRSGGDTSMFKKLVLVLVLGIVFSVAASARSPTCIGLTLSLRTVSFLTVTPLLMASLSHLVMVTTHRSISSTRVFRALQSAPPRVCSQLRAICGQHLCVRQGQEMAECCSCPISLIILSLSVGANLTLKPLTGVPFTGGVIKLVSGQPVSVAGAGTASPLLPLLAIPERLDSTFWIRRSQFAWGCRAIVPDLSAWGRILRISPRSVLRKLGSRLSLCSTAEARSCQ